MGCWNFVCFVSRNLQPGVKISVHNFSNFESPSFGKLAPHCNNIKVPTSTQLPVFVMSGKISTVPAALVVRIIRPPFFFLNVYLCLALRMFLSSTFFISPRFSVWSGTMVGVAGMIVEVPFAYR